MSGTTLDDPLLTINQVAAALNLTPNSVWIMTKRGDFGRVVRIRVGIYGKPRKADIRIPLSHLDDFVGKNTIHSRGRKFDPQHDDLPLILIARILGVKIATVTAWMWMGEGRNKDRRLRGRSPEALLAFINGRWARRIARARRTRDRIRSKINGVRSELSKAMKRQRVGLCYRCRAKPILAPRSRDRKKIAA